MVKGTYRFPISQSFSHQRLFGRLFISCMQEYDCVCATLSLNCEIKKENLWPIMRVLLVDDDPGITDTLSFFLKVTIYKQSLLMTAARL